MTIVEFKVISESEMEKMEKSVNEMIRQGWEPWGNFNVVAPVLDEAACPLFLQAMVKRQP